MRLKAILFIDFPAGVLVELRSGSYHFMVINPKPGLMAGDTVHQALNFEQAGPVPFPVHIISQ